MTLKFVYGGSQYIYSLGQSIAFHGFKLGDGYSIPNPSSKSILKPNTRWDYNPTGGQQGGVAGFSIPTVSGSPLLVWYAAFGTALSSDANAKVQFVPYLPITSCTFNSGAQTATLSFDSTTYGQATSDFTDASLQLITKNGQFFNKVVTIGSNTTSSFTISATANPGLVAGDYILPSPPSPYLYGFLKSFAFDFDSGNITLHNFYIARSLTSSYRGAAPTTGITTSLPATPNVDLRGEVSPIATGVMLNLIVRNTVDNSNGSTLYVSPDSSGIVVAQTGLARNDVADQGINTMALTSFHGTQQLFAWMNSVSGGVAGLTNLGYVE